jgi:hypothetical protein
LQLSLSVRSPPASINAPFTDSRFAWLLLAGGTVLLVVALAAAARRGRQRMWALAGGITVIALLAQCLAPDGLRLSSFTCGELCGEGVDFIPAAAAVAAVAAAAILSVERRWFPRPLLAVVAFILAGVAVLAGVRWWMS